VLPGYPAPDINIAEKFFILPVCSEHGCVLLITRESHLFAIFRGFFQQPVKARRRVRWPCCPLSLHLATALLFFCLWRVQARPELPCE
jgi:hypothetical protein